MSMVVNETKLTAAMTATADAIREKLGSEEAITFDYNGGTGFADAVEAIPQGAEKPEWMNYIDGFGCFFGSNLHTIPNYLEIDLRPYYSSIHFPNLIGGLANTNSNAEIKLILAPQECYWHSPINGIAGTSYNRGIRKLTLRSGDSDIIYISRVSGTRIDLTNVNYAFRGIIKSIDCVFSYKKVNSFESYRNRWFSSTLEDIAWEENSNRYDFSGEFTDCTSLTNASLLSIANAIWVSDATGALKTLGLKPVLQTKCDNIKVNVIKKVDKYDGSEFDFAIESDDGEMTLTQFITNVKGWTIKS